MLEPNDLSNGIEKIANEICNHCQHGKQRKNIVLNGLACGLFYGNSVNERVQRGLHGTAAAISILLSSKKNLHVDVAKKLLVYAKDYNNDPLNADDKLNTIKQAELLAGFCK